MDTISVTRGLTELKLMDKRITKGIMALKSVDIEQKKYQGKVLLHHMTKETFEKTAKSDYQSLQDLIERRAKLKTAIVTSNAGTKVTIGKMEFTVAEAVERRNLSSYRKQLLEMLQGQKADVDRRIEEARTELDNNLVKMVEQNTGKDRKVDREDYDKIAKPFIEANEYVLVDPINIADKIKEVSDDIDNFDANVDIALSESNARTNITI